MQIIWKGQSCFQILTQTGKNNQVYLVTDPFDETIGLRVPKLEADILLISHSHSDHNNLKAVSGKPFLISGPGEYEIKGVIIQGIHSWHDEDYNPPTASSRSSLRSERAPAGKKRLQPPHRPPAFGGPLGENTIYTIEAEDLKLCHLGDFGQKELSADQLERIGVIDILMIPVGGVYTIDSKTAAKVVSQIEPKIVIPMHYQIPERQRRVEMKRQLHRLPRLKVKLEGLDKFLKVVGTKSIEPQNKLTIKKKDLPQEGVKIVVLSP